VNRREAGPGAVIHAVAQGDGERALFGAILQQALDDGMRGDRDAAAWLRSDACLRLLDWLATDGVSAEALQARLIARLRGGR